MKILGIIPSRYQSSRFPGKPLVEIRGKTMLQRVYEQACQATLINQVIIATDDERIYTHALSFGAEVVMTSPDHPSGTDRVAEVAKRYLDYEIILNIQGDEPFLIPKQLDQLCRILMENEQAQIATLAILISSLKTLENPNQVKVVLGNLGQALYFSRQAVPYLRDVTPSEWLAHQCHYKHLGLYAFRRETLLAVSQLPPGRLEQLEKLEQLRWLEQGYSIYVGLTDKESIGIDRPEDLDQLESR